MKKKKWKGICKKKGGNDTNGLDNRPTDFPHSPGRNWNIIRMSPWEVWELSLNLGRRQRKSNTRVIRRFFFPFFLFFWLPPLLFLILSTLGSGRDGFLWLQPMGSSDQFLFPFSFPFFLSFFLFFLLLGILFLVRFSNQNKRSNTIGTRLLGRLEARASPNPALQKEKAVTRNPRQRFRIEENKENQVPPSIPTRWIEGKEG